MHLFIRFTILFIAITLARTNHSFSQPQHHKNKLISLRVDGSKKFQRVDGIGVNANTRSWNEKELEPALNLLLDSMHATIWRVIVETVEKWEDVNDNDDPFTFNWDYYNKLYETPKFQKAWEMIRYLNRHGVTDKLIINFMGFAPKWMGIKVIEPQYEDEYVEMIVSFFHYAIKTKQLKFGFISPTNESDHHQYSEGPHLDGKQHTRIIRKLISRMENLGIMGDIRIVAPDNASIDKSIKEFIPALMEDSVVMSKIAHLGFHTYGGYHRGIKNFIEKSRYPNSSFWITEWNAWCNGCDDGILGEYNYDFAAKSVGYLLDLLKNGARAAIAWEGYDSYYEHHAPSLFSYWGMLGYDAATRTYASRKNFFAIQQVSKFVLPGSWRVSISEPGDSLVALAFYHEASQQLNIVGINKKRIPVNLDGTLANLPAVNNLAIYYTDNTENLRRLPNITAKNNTFKTSIPANCIFTITGTPIKNNAASKPEPKDWYAGDIHVHRNCGDDKVLDESRLLSMMEPNDLAVISVLADMGNGEVKYASEDLLKVNNKDVPSSKPGRIIHWDTEWHWDATYSQFSNQALGGHLVLLGLKEAKQIWEESPYKILEWGKKQNAVKGFAHFQYLNDSIQDELNCCIPIDYPVEAALGNIDFISEDVYGNQSPNNGTYNSEAVINAYYKLLNCGFRVGLAAGTDYPCNNNESLGTLLTYVSVRGPLTYRKWIEGIKNGKTVVSRNGHNEFLELKVNGQYIPGDEIMLQANGTVSIEVKWTAIKELKGRIELVNNGKVVASQQGTSVSGNPVVLKTTAAFSKSGWICARRMDENEHQTHTAPVYITVNKKPVRASAEDARFFIDWIDNILKHTQPGGKWSKFFPSDPQTIRNRYIKARSIYEDILKECNEN